MDYTMHADTSLPIGSGVAEAACKTLVKQGLCGLSMRWKDKGAKVIYLYVHWFRPKEDGNSFGIRLINMVPTIASN
jgi:hypothetical protein